MRQARKDDIDASMNLLRACRIELETQLLEAGSNVPGCRIGSCRLDASQMDRFTASLASGHFTRCDLEDRRQAMLVPCGEPADGYKRLLDFMEVAPLPSAGAPIFSAGWFAFNRALLSTCILRIVDNITGEAIHLSFIHA